MITSTESIDGVEGQYNFVIYLNSTSGEMVISEENVEKVEVMNMVGEKVMEVEGENRIDISKLGSGMYVLRIVTDEGVAMCRVVKR